MKKFKIIIKCDDNITKREIEGAIEYSPLYESCDSIEVIESY